MQSILPTAISGKFVLKRLSQFIFSRKEPSRYSGNRGNGSRTRPTSRSLSWVIPGKLAVGGLPRPGDEATFAQNGIQAILSLCDQCEGELPIPIQQEFECRQITLPDSHYAYALEVKQIAEAVELVQHSIQNQMPIYVHCLAGVERSPTICAAYLCRYYNLEIWEAMNWLKQAHPNSMPTTTQVQVLRDFIEQFCQPEEAQHPRTSL